MTILTGETENEPYRIRICDTLNMGVKESQNAKSCSEIFW